MTPEQFENLREEFLSHETGKYDWDWETDGGEGLKQRIVDARNYLLLLAACLEVETYPEHYIAK